MTGISETPVGDVVPGHVWQNLPEKLRDGYVHGLDEVSADESTILHGPPGAGKSTESVLRLAVYTKQNDVSPRDVTVVTFRKSLAGDIEDQIIDWNVFPGAEWGVPEINPGKWIGTAHAVAGRSSGFIDRIDEDKSEYAGMVDGQAAYAFCEETGIEYYTGPYTDSPWDVFHALYTYCKENLLAVGEWLHIGEEHCDVGEDELRPVSEDEQAQRLLQEFSERTGGASFRSWVAAWESWKAQHDCHDYYEMLESGLAGKLPGMEYVIIDELHDAYPLLSRLFERWIDAAETVLIAGDPHQVCNSFSGSHPGIFTGLPMRVDRDLPVIGLPKSHRVPDEHFRAAARMLDRHHNPPVLETAGRGEITEHSPSPEMEIVGRDDGWKPLPYGADGNPVALYDEYGSDIMFLARTQLLVDGVGACLDAGGVIYRSQDGVAGNWEARLDLMNALHTVTVTSPAGRSRTQLSVDEAGVLLQHTDERLLTGSRSDALDRLGEKTVLQQSEYVTLQEFGEFVSEQFWAAMGQGRDSLTNLVYLDKRHGFSKEPDRDVIAMQRAWDRYHDGGQFAGLPDLADVETKLWTQHASKGDEAAHTAVYTGATGRVRDSVREHEEMAANESRTWYVALSRAKQSMHLVHDWADVTAGDYDPLPDDLVERAKREAREARAGADAGNRGESA